MTFYVTAVARASGLFLMFKYRNFIKTLGNEHEDNSLWFCNTRLENHYSSLLQGYRHQYNMLSVIRWLYE